MAIQDLCLGAVVTAMVWPSRRDEGKMDMDPLTRLRAGIEQAEEVISQIDPGQYDQPTPCTEWNVGQVINHMIGALAMFRDVAAHGEVDPALFSQDLIGDDAVKSLLTAGDAAVTGWAAPGKMDGMAKLPFGEFPAVFALQLPAMDMLVHSWDLATATGQQVNWNPDLVEDTRGFCEATFTSAEFRGDDFAPPVMVADDADELSKLVAFMGRTP